jgi:imidazolonepropionase
VRVHPLLLTNIKQLLTLRGEAVPRRGRALGKLGIIEDAAVLCSGGQIVAAGKRRELRKRVSKRTREVDCGGRVALPGFVDPHTHAAFVSPRLVDFEQRINRASYEQIAEAGGGIRSSVAAVRKASRAELASHVLEALQQMAQHGTTTVECKSGYGLSVEGEIKSLEAIREAAKKFPGAVVPTLLGAHVVPAEFAERRSEYVKLVCEEMIPAAARRKLATYVDVFVEPSAFSETEAERIFTAARQHRLGIRGHVCQLTTTQAGWLARATEKYGIASLDHLECASTQDIAALAKLDVVLTLLPGATYFLGLQKYAPARELIAAGAAVALATDFNPGTSPTLSMPMVLSLACTQMKMTPAEATTAATINAAYSLGLAMRKGSIEPGKDADLAIFDVQDHREMAYWFGVNRCWATVIAGHLFHHEDTKARR